MREAPQGRSPAEGGGDSVRRHAGLRRSIVAVATFALVSVALWAWAFDQHGRPIHNYKFLLWGVLVLALGVASGAVFEFGLRQRTRIVQLVAQLARVGDDVQHVAWKPAVWSAVGISCAVGLLASVNFAIAPSAGAPRGVALTVLAIVGAAPPRRRCLAFARSCSSPAGQNRGRTPVGFRLTWNCGRWPPGCCERSVRWSP